MVPTSSITSMVPYETMHTCHEGFTLHLCHHTRKYLSRLYMKLNSIPPAMPTPPHERMQAIYRQLVMRYIFLFNQSVRSNGSLALTPVPFINTMRPVRDCLCEFTSLEPQTNINGGARYTTFIDNSHTDLFGSLATTPVSFTLMPYNNETRRKNAVWRPIL